MKKIIFAAAALAIIGSSQIIPAHAENFDIGGAFGAGVLLGPPSTGAGIMGSYWFTNNIGISALATAAYNDYSEYGIRIDYLFDVDAWSNAKIRPFVGAGFSMVDGPSGHGSGTFSTWNYDVDGNGIELHAGILHQAYYLSNHLFFSVAAVYHTFDIDVNTSHTIDYTGRYGNYHYRSAYSYDADWSDFGIEFGIQYFF